MGTALVLDKSCYSRDLDFLKFYYRDATTFISKMKDIDEDKALELVRKVTAPDGKYPLFNPRMLYLDNSKQGHRIEKETTVLDFMRDVSDKRYIMAATFTCYTHPDELESPTAQYIVGELANRTTNKGLMQKYDREGDKKKKNIYKNRQNRNKIKCNSVSGGHGTKSSVLFHQTAHSTLTSTCRSGTSNTNANLEKFLTGNRHYFDADCAIHNIISICNLTDMDLVQAAMDKYDLVYPSIDDLCVHVKRSTDLYWHSKPETNNIRKLITKLSPIERAAVMYVSDLYALKQLNEAFVRGIFDKLHKPDYVNKVDNPEEWIAKLSGDDKALLGIMANKELQYRELKDKTLRDEAETFNILGATSKQLFDTVDDIDLLAKAFWLTKNMPVSVARFPKSIRRCVIASDTDSAIFTMQHWTEWFVGELNFGEQSMAISAVTTYLCSQVTTHLLMSMMANFGSAPRHIDEFQMKNEYYFMFFALTNMAKCYFAAMAAKEGLVYRTPNWEVKGAQLKNSNAPEEFVKRAEEMIKEFGTTIMNGGKIDLQGYMKEIAEREAKLIDDIRKGSIDFFSRARIKPRDSYSETASHSPYDQYTLWQDVFAPKYGDCSAPPYAAVRLNIEADTPTKLNAWIDSMADPEVGYRLRKWMQERNKKQLTSLCLPVDLITTKGIPVEIEQIMDIRGMVMKLMRTFYLLLETLGMFLLNTHNTRMLSDQLPA